MLEVVNVLQIEDSPTVVELTRAMLAEGNGSTIVFESVGTLAEGIKRISRGCVDVVLLDLILPDSEGLDTFRVLNAAAKVPVVIYTNVDDEQKSLVALQEGASDYLVKSEVTPQWLVHALKYAVVRNRPMSSNDSAEKSDPPLVERLLDIQKSVDEPETFLAKFTTPRVISVVALEAAKKRLLNLTSRSDCNRIELDCSDVEYVANAAISTLLIVLKKAKAANTRLLLTNVSAQVYEQFSSRRFDKVFEIERTDGVT